MRTNHFRRQSFQVGVTLIETVIFIIVVSVGLSVLVTAFSAFLGNSVDPIVQVRALECAQAKLDEIMARKFDENSPTGGVPPCGSAETGATACAGISNDSDFDDVGDYDGQVDNSRANCSISVTVSNAGGDLGLAIAQARLITVDVTSPGGGIVTLSTYKANF
ncbi:hypothetical protein NBRC116494_14420 [Aurantivibrio plasticivorans]